MCTNATKTAASLMSAIEPTVINLLTLLGISTSTEGVAAIDAFNAAQKALAAWTPGTAAQTVIEAINAFVQVFDVLPIPEDAKALANIISAGIVTVIGVVTANSPAPAPAVPANSASAEETTLLHQAAVIHETTVKVNELVPGFKRAIFTAPSHQYNNAWRKGVEASDAKYAVLADA